MVVAQDARLPWEAGSHWRICVLHRLISHSLRSPWGNAISLSAQYSVRPEVVAAMVAVAAPAEVAAPTAEEGVAALAEELDAVHWVEGYNLLLAYSFPFALPSLSSFK